MTIAELLGDAFGRVHETVHEAVDGLTPGQLAFRPESGANSIAWLVWHLTRIQDDHIADVAGTGQVWTSTRNPPTWADRFGLPFAAAATGYGHGSEANIPLGRAVIGGQLVSVTLTLFVVPVLYRMLAQKAPAPAKKMIE